MGVPSTFSIRHVCLGQYLLAADCVQVNNANETPYPDCSNQEKMGVSCNQLFPGPFLGTASIGHMPVPSAPALPSKSTLYIVLR